MPRNSHHPMSDSLAQAAAKGCVEELEKAQDVTSRYGDNKDTLLHIAARHGQVDVCNYLLQREATLATEVNAARKLAIFEAIEAQQYQAALRLAHCEGQNAPVLCAEGRTPLHILAGHLKTHVRVEEKDTVFVLVDRLAHDKAHLNCQDFLSETAVYSFLKLQNADGYIAAKQLMAMGADLTAVSEDTWESAQDLLERYQRDVAPGCASAMFMSLEEYSQSIDEQLEREKGRERENMVREEEMADLPPLKWTPH